MGFRTHLKNSSLIRIIVLLTVLATTRHLGWSDPSVVVLKSAALRPYDLAIHGMEKELGTQLQVYNMSGNESTGRSQLSEAIAAHPEVIVTVGWKATQIALNENSNIPIVFTMVIQLGQNNLSTNNATGIFLNIPPKIQFGLLKKAIPSVKRIGAIYNPTNSERQIELAKHAADALGMELVTAEISSARDVPDALQKILPNIDALWMVPDSTVLTEDSFRYINKVTFENKIPFLVFSQEFVKAGGLIAMSPDYEDIGKQTAKLIQRIKNGAAPSNISPAFPEKVIPVINRKTMEQIGIKIPSSVLEGAKIY